MSGILWNVLYTNSPATHDAPFSWVGVVEVKELGNVRTKWHGELRRGFRSLTHSWWGKPRAGWSWERLEGIFIAAVQHVHPVQPVHAFGSTTRRQLTLRESSPRHQLASWKIQSTRSR